MMKRRFSDDCGRWRRRWLSKALKLRRCRTRCNLRNVIAQLWLGRTLINNCKSRKKSTCLIASNWLCSWRKLKLSKSTLKAIKISGAKKNVLSLRASNRTKIARLFFLRWSTMCSRPFPFSCKYAKLLFTHSH